MIPLSQRDSRWKNIPLGTSGTTTIGTHGCTITALAMILGTTPDLVNECLKQIQGYAQGNLVIWGKLEKAFPGIKVKRVWSYNNADVKANTPNVLVEVDGKPIGGARHWLVYIGSAKALDPWDGKEKSTSLYSDPLSYCVIGGKWNKPSPATDLQSESDKLRFSRDSHWNDLVKIKDALVVSGEYSLTTILSRIDQLVGYEVQMGKKDEEIARLKEQAVSFQQELEKALQVNTEAQKVIAEHKQVEEALQSEREDLKKKLEDSENIMRSLGDKIEQLKQAQPVEAFTPIQLIVLGISKLVRG